MKHAKTKKRNPYGLSDFTKVQTDGCYYVDKTTFIPDLEKAAYFAFLIRPRRFGKSLFLSVLNNYYDIQKREIFDQLFQGTWIHEHPTEERNKYFILSLNFSMIDPAVDRVEASFDRHLNNALKVFCRKYKALLGDIFIQDMEDFDTGIDKLSFLLASGQLLPHKVYLLIDEYDNFANTILSTLGKKTYHYLTRDKGFFRYFFNLFKGGSTGSEACLARMFIAGVSPVTMDDVTSGFNIGINISLNPAFADLLGFNETEVRSILAYYAPAMSLKYSEEILFKLMQDWYGGYRFTFSEQKTNILFSPEMIFYFVNWCLSAKELPSTLVDSNIKIDYSKLRHLLLVDKQLNGNFPLLSKISVDEGIVGTVQDSFPLEKIAHRDNFVSLLFYFGLLSHHGRHEGGAWLAIPNRTVKDLIYGYLRDGYEDSNAFRVDVFLLAELIRKMAYHGEWRAVFEYLSNEICAQTSIRDYIEGEGVIKTFMLAYLNISDVFLVSIEKELSKGYADIFLEPFLLRYPDCPLAYLIELKYLDRKKFTEKKLQQAVESGIKQLKRYKEEKKVRQHLDVQEVKALLLVFRGWELVHQSEVN